MVNCSCGKTIEKVPNWLRDVKVDFICNNCPNRSTKNIAIISMEIDKKLAGGAASAATITREEDDYEEED